MLHSLHSARIAASADLRLFPLEQESSLTAGRNPLHSGRADVCSDPGALQPEVQHGKCLGKGTARLSASPLRVYGMRAACATWAFVGVFFLLVARDPTTYAPFLNLAIAGLLFVGLVCLITGVAVSMRPPWYLTDVAFCWVIGLLLLRWRQPRSVASEEAAGQ
jgi:hypothetical protein